MRRILVLCISYFFSQESQTIADYENMNLVGKAKAQKNFKKNFSPRWIFQKFGAQDSGFARFSSNFDTTI